MSAAHEASEDAFSEPDDVSWYEALTGHPAPTDDAKRLDNYITAALNDEVRNVAEAPEGTRNDTLNKAAFNLGQLIHLGLTELIVANRLYQACKKNGYVRDHGDNSTHATIQRSLNDGKKHPRQIPDNGKKPPAPVATAAAAESVDDRLDELRARLLDSDGLDRIPDPEPLIHDWLYLDSLAWLHGKPGHGKTFLGLDWAASVATGTNWLGHPVTQGPVLYVVAEGARGIRRRIRAWEAAAGHKATGLHFLPVPIQMLDAADISATRQLAVELKARLVVLDTQARVSLGAEENSASDMGRLIAAADSLRAVTGATILFVHHEPRTGENPRGSTALEGAAVTVARIVKDGAWLTLASKKNKDDEDAPPLHLRLVPTDESAVLVSHDGMGPTDDLADSQKTLLTTLRDSFGTTGARPGELLEASGLAKTTYHRARNALLTRGAIRNDGTDKRPLYFPSAGQELL